MFKKIISLCLSVFVLTLIAVNAGGGYDWYFKPNKTHTPPQVIPEAKEILDKYSTVYYGKNDKIYLTFDSGYDNGYHGAILDTLKEKGVTGAFFVDGNFLKNNPDTAKRIIAEGHLLCNHSKTHPDTTKLSETDFKEQITGWEEICKDITGTSGSKFFRPPMGKFTENTLKYTEELGYKTVFWSYAYKDWLNDNQPSHEYALQNLRERIHPGAVILLHSTSKTNSEILGAAIDMLRADGYEFASLSEL